MELLAVAQKYQMDSVLSHIRGIIARKDPPFIRPETAFAFISLHKNTNFTKRCSAARVTLRLPMVIEDLGDKLDFPGMTGAYLHELWKYHERVRTDLKSDLLEFRSSGLPEDVKSLRCNTVFQFFLLSSHNVYPSAMARYLHSVHRGTPHLFDLISNSKMHGHFTSRVRPNLLQTCSCVEYVQPNHTHFLGSS
jgi:hypothetical protein